GSRPSRRRFSSASWNGSFGRGPVAGDLVLDPGAEFTEKGVVVVYVAALFNERQESVRPQAGETATVFEDAVFPFGLSTPTLYFFLVEPPHFRDADGFIN